MSNTTMLNTFPENIIMAFPINMVDLITVQLALGNIRQLQEKLTVNLQAIQTPCSQIGHATLLYDTPITCYLDPPPPPNSGISHGFVFQYHRGDINQQTNNREQKYKPVKDKFNTMEEVENHLKNHINLTVYNNYLKVVRQVTLGSVDCNTITSLQYLFNMFDWVNLRYKERNYESMIKLYKSSTPIDWNQYEHTTYTIIESTSVYI